MLNESEHGQGLENTIQPSDLFAEQETVTTHAAYACAEAAKARRHHEKPEVGQ